MLRSTGASSPAIVHEFHSSSNPGAQCTRWADAVGALHRELILGVTSQNVEHGRLVVLTACHGHRS